MGVTGLWTVVQPCARPIKIETLNKKRLAVDASIWIYQFLKAVRDKEGNALRNSHVVGFFRRICKLLFIGIKPVFVFDGGAPILKRQTVSGRKARREGRREDAVRTAGKLLAVQMQRRAEEDDRKRREDKDRPTVDLNEEEVPDNPVYVDEIQMTAQERQQNRRFKKKDAYHLPELDVSLADMGAPNDPRIMSTEELEEYARQFHTGEDVNVYDFSKIDFNSPFFLSLPASDRYNILNAARLRSRLRMGYSKEQLDTMFPDRMAFSRFQVDRVKERNELTQRLMNINGMNGEDAMLGVNGGGRVAGEKGREYVLVKNDGVEGGWALGVVSNKTEGERNKPIDVERVGRTTLVEIDEDDETEDDGFEDIPIEGLNRLPKRRPSAQIVDLNNDPETKKILKRRQALYEARRKAAGVADSTIHALDTLEEDPEALFVAQEPEEGQKLVDELEDNDLFEDVQPPEADEDEELQRAIAMSLEDPGDNSDLEDAPAPQKPTYVGPRIDRPLEFNQKNARAGRAFAHATNARAHGAAPKPLLEDSDEEGNTASQPVPANLISSAQKVHAGPHVFALTRPDEPSKPALEVIAMQSPPITSGFDGPLPFESLKLGKSMLGKKKKADEEESGGFEKDDNTEEVKPLPPWFSGNISEGIAAQRAVENKQFEGGDLETENMRMRDILKRQQTGEVIDLDAPNENSNAVIEVDSSDDEEEGTKLVETDIPIDSEIRMGDVADLIRAEPPESEMPPNESRPGRASTKSLTPNHHGSQSTSEEEEPIEWEESDCERDTGGPTSIADYTKPAGGEMQFQPSKSPSPVFENVGVVDSLSIPQECTTIHTNQENPVPSLPAAQTTDSLGVDAVAAVEEDIYSDPEDADLMRQLAVEAEEHARFASSLNSRSQLQNAEDYERELRQLRNQQKKDRRDADEVSHIMITECQQLLKLFGLPYITAPMEAEAQCAELVKLGLVDGIVTDDSDIFLFGGTRVYKNMFNQAKFVECYLSSDLEKEYSLNRENLIQIAHLLGSDYTEGLPSVGPVTALEIISDFGNLENFSTWWSRVQMGQKLSAEDTSTPFRRKFKRNAAKLFLPHGFPDKRVDQAYLHPEVDGDPSQFAWGVPDLDALRQFLMATIGWTQERTDEVLVPVIKDMNRRENEGTQANITRFFEGGVGVGAAGKQMSAFAPRRRLEGKSKRMETALGKLHQQARNRTVGEGEVISQGIEGDIMASDQLDKQNHGDRGSSDTPKKPRSRKRATPRQESLSDVSGHDEYQLPSHGTKRKKNGLQRQRIQRSKP